MLLEVLSCLQKTEWSPGDPMISVFSPAAIVGDRTASIKVTVPTSKHTILESPLLILQQKSN